MEKPYYPEHRITYRPPLSVIDIGGIIYNSRYLDIYNYARDEYMRSIGYPYSEMNASTEKHLAVVEANIKYRKPIYYDQESTIVSQVQKIRATSIVFNQQIFINSETLCNEATFIMVSVSKEFKPSNIPDKLKQAFLNGPKSN